MQLFKNKDSEPENKPQTVLQEPEVKDKENVNEPENAPTGEAIVNVRTPDRQKAIQAQIAKTEKFNNDTNKNVTIQPNIEAVVVFPTDWYVDYGDLYQEAVSQLGKAPEEAANYAEQNFKIKHKLEDSTERPGEKYGRTTFKVTEPNSMYPDMSKYLGLTSKPAIDAIMEKLGELSMKHNGPIIMKILKKVGATKFDVEWKIKADPFVPK